MKRQIKVKSHIRKNKKGGKKKYSRVRGHRKKIKVKKGGFFDDEPVVRDEDGLPSLDEDLRKFREERERELNDPRFADPKETEDIFFEQIADRTRKSQEDDEEW